MRWWNVLIAVMVGFVLAIVWKRNPLRQIQRELRGIEEAAAAEKLALEKGNLIARRKIEERHAEAIAKFDDDQRRQAEILAGDPAALARWINRISE